MRLHIPRLLRLVILLLVVWSLITSSWLYVVQAANTMPRCMLYGEGGRVELIPKLVDLRSGQISDVEHAYFAPYQFPTYRPDISPSGHAFVLLADTYVALRNYLFIGATGGAKLRKVTEGQQITGGWSADGNSYAYIDNDQRERITILDAAGNQKSVRLLLGTASNHFNLYFAGWSADGKYVAAMTFGEGATSTYYFASADSPANLAAVSVLSDPYIFSGGLRWSPQGDRYAYIDNNKPAHLVIANPKYGVEQQFALSASDEDFIKVPVDWSPDGRNIVLHIGVADDAHKNKSSSWDYWTSTIYGVDGSVHDVLRENNLKDAIYERPQGWWSSDGGTWFFRQQSYANDMKGSDDHIVSYQIETSTQHVMTDHVAGAPILNGGSWVAIPIWLDGGMNIALISKDNTRQHAIDQNYDEILNMRWLDNQRTLFYVARQGDLLAVGVANSETGEVLFQLDNVDKSLENYLVTYLSLSGQQLVLKVGEPGQQSLYLISLATKWSRHIRADGYSLSDLVWSADDASVAFIQYDKVEKIDVLHIVAAEGTTLHQVALPSDEFKVVLGWMWCP